MEQELLLQAVVFLVLRRLCPLQKVVLWASQSAVDAVGGHFSGVADEQDALRDGGDVPGLA